MYSYDKILQQMIKHDDVTKGKINEHNSNWSPILDHRYKILIIRGSGCEKNHYLIKLNNEVMMMIIMLLIKFIYMLRIQMKQNINILLKKT